MKYTLFALMISTLVLTACGAQDAIDATRSMPAKLDDTNTQVRKSNEQMAEMNEIINQQPVQISFENLLSAELGRDLSPIPFDLMPFAEKFGEYASGEEVVKVVYLWMKKLNEVTLDAENPTPEQIQEFNHRKLHVYSALQAVCGLLPQAKVQEVIDAEISGNGRFQTAAMQLLMLRSMFLRDVMLEASLFSEPLDNVGKFEKSIEYADSIDFIARLPFAKELKVKISGFLDPYPVIEESFDVGIALQTWTKILIKADRSLVVAPKDWTGDSKVNQKLFKDRQDRSTAAYKTVRNKIREWSAGQP